MNICCWSKTDVYNFLHYSTCVNFLSCWLIQMVHKLGFRTALYLKICLIHCSGDSPFSATPLSFSLPGVVFNYQKQIGYLYRYHVKLNLWNLCLTEILVYKSKYKFHSVNYSHKNKHFPLFTLWQYPLLDIGIVAAEKATAATKVSSSNSAIFQIYTSSVFTYHYHRAKTNACAHGHLTNPICLCWPRMFS